MDYLGTKEAGQYANLSKSTLKRYLKDILNKYGLTYEDTPELIQEKASEIKKVEKGGSFYWEYSVDYLNTIRRPFKVRSEESEPIPEPPKELPEPMPNENESSEVISALVQELGEKNKQIAELHQLLNQAHRLLAPPPKE